MHLMKLFRRFCGLTTNRLERARGTQLYPMQINLSILISLFAIFSYSVLLIIVFRRDDQSRLLRSFGYYLMIMIVWGFGAFMIFIDSGIGDTMSWNRFMAIGQLAMPLAFYRFVQFFLQRPVRKIFPLGVVSFLAIVVLDTFGLLIKDSYVSDGLLYYELGPFPVVLLPALLWSVFIGLSTLDLYQAYRASKDSAFRNRIRYLLLGVLAIFMGSLTNATDLRHYPVDIVFNLISAVIISYAIFRHQLLDIRIIVRRGLVYSIPTAFIGALYFFTISLAQNLFEAVSGVEIIFLTFVVAIFTAIVIQPLREKAQGWVDHLFFREKYDAGLMIQRISNITSGSIMDLDELTNLILDEITSTLHIQNAGVLMLDHKEGDYKLITHIGLDDGVDIAFDQNHPIITALTQQWQIISKDDLDILPEFKSLWKQEKTALESIRAELFVPLKIKEKLIGVFTLGPKLSEETYSQDEYLTLTTLSNQTAVAMENAHLFGDVTVALNREKQLNAISGIINGTLTLESLHKDVVQLACEIIGADAGLIALVEEENDGLTFPYIFNLPDGSFNKRNPNGRGIIGTIISNKKPYLVNESRPSKETIPELEMVVINSLIGVPLIAGDDLIGALVLCGFTPSTRFDSRDVDIIESIGRNSGIAIQNAQFYKQTLEALDREQQLHQITRTISSELEIQPIFDTVGNLIADIVGADLVAMVIYDPAGKDTNLTFQYDPREKQEEEIPNMENGLMERVYREGSPIAIEDYSEYSQPDAEWLAAGVTGFIGVPVYAGEKKIGSLGLFSSTGSSFPFKKNARMIVEILGQQIGIAIQNALLYEELEEAYLETITALANAMDLRDTYTNAHSLRLANWAVETAVECGCAEDEVETIRWGALLHDIGKIGIPDHILQKPGPLTEEEWEVMEKHPEFGAEIITPIKRLKLVAPIILAHQERFDGTGYPNRLKGQQIPLGARILAVVDTYGAIIDDRVYRRGKDEYAAIEEIQKQSGTQFDPFVVQAFIKVKARAAAEVQES